MWRTPPGQNRARPRPPLPFAAKTHTMEFTARARRSYAAPRLVVYGRLEALTLTVQENMNKNDPVQGGNNLKT
jgi:hypothetical protein